jgi:hypothetical protein
LLLGVIAISCGISNEKFLTLTQSQKGKFDELAARVRPLVTHDWMLGEVYLIRWLREAKFDVHLAERKIQKHLQWRKDNDVDGILDQPGFQELDAFFTTELVGCDREGFPVAAVFVKDWDVRAFLSKFGNDVVLRYCDKVVEEITTMQRRMEEEGQNVTQFSVLFDSAGFNLGKHACPNCLLFGMKMAARLQYNYPGYLHKVVMVNSPDIAEPLYEIAGSFVSRTIMDSVSVFGSNKGRWQKALKDWIDPSQLTTHFGGRRKKGLDLHQIRLSGKTISCSGNMWNQ